MTKFMSQQYTTAKSSKLNTKIKERITVSRISLSIVLLCLIVFAGFSYLFFVNQTATGGFDIKGYENKITALEKANKQLELQAAQLKSLSVIEQATADMDMVAANDVEYIVPADTAMAVR